MLRLSRLCWLALTFQAHDVCPDASPPYGCQAFLLTSRWTDELPGSLGSSGRPDLVSCPYWHNRDELPGYLGSSGRPDLISCPHWHSRSLRRQWCVEPRIEHLPPTDDGSLFLLVTGAVSGYPSRVPSASLVLP